MQLKIIVAGSLECVDYSPRYVMGNKNKLPWEPLPRYTGYFFEKTKSHPIVMGRKTWDSIPRRSRPLRGCHNIVLSRNPNLHASGATVHSSHEVILNLAKNEEVFIIGGEEMVKIFLPFACAFYLTDIHTRAHGTSFFQKPDGRWKIIYEEFHPADAINKYGMTFKKYIPA